MNRIEYMNRLRALLSDIPAEEREEAMQYYNDYFDDAGVENEMDVIKELGSPENLAKSIKEDIKEDTGDQGEYTEMGYRYSSDENKQVPANPKKPWGSNLVKILLIILIIVVGAPVIFPIAATIFSILIALVAILIGILIAGVVVAIVGITLIVMGFIRIPVTIVAAIGLAGAGLLLLAFGLAATVLIWKFAIKVIPSVFCWIVEKVRKLFHKGE